MYHLNVRVPWHDSRWNGAVCAHPAANAFCVDLDRIRAGRDDAAEEKLAGCSFAELKVDQFPPCQFESGAFMNPTEWTRTFVHPYQEIQKAHATHGQLLPTPVKVPPYATFAVPYLWMLRESQKRIDQSIPEPLPPDDSSPFKSPWVFSRQRQEALCNLFFSRLTPEESLVFLYTKSGHPLSESISRLIIGVGRIDWISGVLWYDSLEESTYPIWDRLFRHSIRPDGTDGFLIPYHNYLESTGDPEEDDRRRDLLNEVAVVPEPSHRAAFSYAGELADSDVALSALTRCLEAVRKVREHGIVPGKWQQREDWLNTQIAAAWRHRGDFPGTGAALEAMGMRLGTALMLELVGNATISVDDDPWPLIDTILRGERESPNRAYASDIKAVAATWTGLTEERRALLKLLSRFSLSPDQARRWFDPGERAKATRSVVDDRTILENPYRMAETDLRRFQRTSCLPRHGRPGPPARCRRRSLESGSTPIVGRIAVGREACSCSACSGPPQGGRRGRLASERERYPGRSVEAGRCTALRGYC